MSLVVETGSAISNAESLASVADFRAYFASIGVDVSALTDTQVEQSLRKATNYMEQKYRERWLGYRVNLTQALSWPRSWVEIKDAPAGYGQCVSYYAITDIPKQVAWSCCELAYRSTTQDLMADKKQQVLSRTVGPLTTVYDKYSSQQTQYASIDAWLQPLLKIGGGGVQMVRC
jgi:hypothetical protein